MTVYAVTAIAIDPVTNAVIAEARTEEIDTDTNELFRYDNGPWEVEDTYERFWNRLNPSWEHDFPTGHDKIKVISVVQL